MSVPTMYRQNMVISSCTYVNGWFSKIQSHIIYVYIFLKSRHEKISRVEFHEYSIHEILRNFPALLLYS